MESSQQKILSYCLKNSLFDGWNTKLLENASIAAGLDANYHLILFPGGVADVLQFFTEETNRQMAETVNLEGLGMTKKVEASVLARIELLKPYKAALKGLLKAYAINPLAATKSAYSAVDAIWRLAGDKATDFNFYSKRMLLAGVYTATLWKFLDDSSENHEDTKVFLSSRLAEVGKFGKFMGGIKRKFGLS